MNEDSITPNPTDYDGGQPQGGDDGTQSGVSIKDVLGATLGKQFASDEAALKSVKDTFSYVGMKQEDVMKRMGGDNSGGATRQSENKETNNVDTSKFISKEQYERDMFFSKNSQYEPYADLLKGLAVANNVSIQEAAKLDTFKNVFEKATAYDNVQKSKSVLETNPRLGQVTDKLSKAREFAAAGNTNAAQEAAVSAVLDSLMK